MPRLALIFIGFIALATASGGAAFQNGLSLLNGSSTPAGMFIFLVSTLLFTFAMLVSSRIIYLTAPKRS